MRHEGKKKTKEQDKVVMMLNVNIVDREFLHEIEQKIPFKRNRKNFTLHCIALYKYSIGRRVA